MVERAAWQPIELELVRGDYIARVTRDRRSRWRWAVSPLDIVQRWHSKPVQHAYARGYCRSREKAMRMVEVAIVALRKAAKDNPNPFAVESTTTVK